MYGENGGKLRVELTVLLRQHRIQQRIGGRGSHTVPQTTNVHERRELGEQIARYRHGVLVWCLQAVHAANPGISLEGASARSRGPVEELRLRLDSAAKHSAAGLPSMAELTTAQGFPMVENWRQTARAAAMGEQDFDAGVGHGRLSNAQCMTVLKDAADVARALVGLDRRYSNIPGWKSLTGRGRLGRAAEACATLAGVGGPDYAVDLRGWRPAPTTIEGPAPPGMAGVLQAEHNLSAHLTAFPDARSLRVVLDSQRVVSRAAATLIESTDPERAGQWRRRETTFARLISGTRDIGGEVGNGAPAAVQAAVAASRIQRLTPDEAADPATVGQLSRLFARIDDQISQIVEHGARERLYFLRVPYPRIDEAAAGLVKTARERYIPITSAVPSDLLATARTQLRTSPTSPRAPVGAAQSRADFEAAIAHRAGRDAGPSISL